MRPSPSQVPVTSLRFHQSLLPRFNHVLIPSSPLQSCFCPLFPSLLQLRVVEDDHNEAEFLARAVKELVLEGVHPEEEIAVLFRTHTHARLIEQAMVCRAGLVAAAAAAYANAAVSKLALPSCAVPGSMGRFTGLRYVCEIRCR
jgi:hypothetical protein